MLNELKKSLLAGLGAALLTKDRVEEVTRKLVDDARISKEDAERLTEELVQTGERQWDELEKSVAESFRNGLDRLNMASRRELQELQTRVEDLEMRLSMLEKANRKGEGEEGGF